MLRRLPVERMSQLQIYLFLWLILFSVGFGRSVECEEHLRRCYSVEQSTESRMESTQDVWQCLFEIPASHFLSVWTSFVAFRSQTVDEHSIIRRTRVFNGAFKFFNFLMSRFCLRKPILFMYDPLFHDRVYRCRCICSADLF